MGKLALIKSMGPFTRDANGASAVHGTDAVHSTIWKWVQNAMPDVMSSTVPAPSHVNSFIDHNVFYFFTVGGDGGFAVSYQRTLNLLHFSFSRIHCQPRFVCPRYLTRCTLTLILSSSDLLCNV